MTTSVRRALALVAAAATAAAGPLVWAPPAQAAPTTTDYGFSGRAYGTQAKVESAGVASARTVPAYLSCTRRTGVDHSNALAETSAGEGAALHLEGVDNRSWSYRSPKSFGTKSRSKTAKAVLGDPAGPHITIKALRTDSHAFVVRRTDRLGAKSAFVAGDVISETGTPLDDAVGGLGDLLGEIGQEPDNELAIPGLGVLSLGNKRNVVRRAKATSNASALRAQLYGADSLPGGGDDVRVILGKSRSAIRAGQVAGIFKGKGVPVEAQALDGLVQVGRVNDLPLPCEGTRGKVRTASSGSGDLFDAGALAVGAVRARTFGVVRRDDSARAWTEGTVAELDLGAGSVVVTGIEGRATVETNARGRVVRRSTQGSQIASLVIDGEERGIPDPGQAITVPGVAKLQFFTTDRSKRGLTTTALRATLLDGTGAVIDLGEARTFIKKD